MELPDDGQTNCPKHIVSCRSKFGKFVHLVGFIIKKFVTMHGHMNLINDSSVSVVTRYGL
jgi:hypothetical protein